MIYKETGSYTFVEFNAKPIPLQKSEWNDLNQTIISKDNQIIQLLDLVNQLEEEVKELKPIQEENTPLIHKGGMVFKDL